MGFFRRLLTAVGLMNGVHEPAEASIDADACADGAIAPAARGDCGACEPAEPTPGRRPTQAIMKQQLESSSEARKKNAGTLKQRLDFTQRLLDQKLEEKGKGLVGG